MEGLAKKMKANGRVLTGAGEGGQPAKENELGNGGETEGCNQDLEHKLAPSAHVSLQSPWYE